MMPPDPPTISDLNALLLGDFSSADLHPVETAVRDLIDPDQLRRFSSLEKLTAGITEGWIPDVVIVGQNWSDEFPNQQVHRLLSLFPLARWYCCFGPWCDADGRTRDLWPLAIRLRAAEAPERLRRDFLNTSTTRPLPWTASRSEIFEQLAEGAPAPPNLRSLRIAVSSPDRAWHDMWLSALRRAGAQILSSDELSRAQSLLWDADPWDGSKLVQLSNLKRHYPQLKITAAMGLYSAALADELRRHGCTSVVCKLSPIRTVLEEFSSLK